MSERFAVVGVGEVLGISARGTGIDRSSHRDREVADERLARRALRIRDRGRNISVGSHSPSGYLVACPEAVSGPGSRRPFPGRNVSSRS